MSIDSILIENRVFVPSDEFVAQGNVSGLAAYQALCQEAEDDYEGFWARLARENLTWQKPFTQVLDDSNAPFYHWFADVAHGKTNNSRSKCKQHTFNGSGKCCCI